MVVKGASWIIGPQKKPNWKDVVSPTKKPLGIHNTSTYELQDNSRRVSQRIEREVAESPPSSPMPLSFSRHETGQDSEDDLCPRPSPSSSPSPPPPAKCRSGVLRFKVPNTISPSSKNTGTQPRQGDTTTKPRRVSTTSCQSAPAITRPRFSVSTSTTPRSSLYSTITPSKTPNPATLYQPPNKAPIPPRSKSPSTTPRSKSPSTTPIRTVKVPDTKCSPSESVRPVATPAQVHTRTTSNTRSYTRMTSTIKPSVTKPAPKREGPSHSRTTTQEAVVKSQAKVAPVKVLSAKQESKHGTVNEKEQRPTVAKSVSNTTVVNNQTSCNKPVQPLLPPLAVEQCSSSSTKYQPGAPIRTPVETTPRRYAPQLTPPSSPPPSNITLDLEYAKDSVPTAGEDQEEQSSISGTTNKINNVEETESPSPILPKKSSATVAAPSPLPPPGLAGQEPTPSSTPVFAPQPRRLFASDTPLPRNPLVKISKDPSVLLVVMVGMQQHRERHLGHEVGRSLSADKQEPNVSSRKPISLKDKQTFLKLQEQRRKNNSIISCTVIKTTSVEKSCDESPLSLSGYQLTTQSPSASASHPQTAGALYLSQNSSIPHGSFPAPECSSCQCKTVSMGRATSPSTQEEGHLLCKSDTIVSDLAVTTPTITTSNPPFPPLPDSQFSPSVAIPQPARPSGHEEASLPDFFAQTPSPNRLDRRYYPGNNQGTPLHRNRSSSALSTTESLLYPQDPYAPYYPWTQRGSGTPQPYLSLPPQHFQDKQAYHPWQQWYPEYPYRDHPHYIQEYHQHYSSFPDASDIPPPPPSPLASDPHTSETPPHLYPPELNPLMGPMHPYYGRYRDDFRPQQFPYPGESEQGRRGQWPMVGSSVPVGHDLDSKPATTRSQGSQDERPEVETSHPQQQPPPPPAREYDWRDGFLSPCSDHLGHPNPRASPKHSRPVRSASDTAEVPAATTHDDPPTHDLDILSKRLANVGLMDSMCPAAPAGAPTDERWATQVHSLLTHLANKVDAEIESQSFMRRRKAFHRSNSMANVGQGGMPGASGLTGVYEHVLKDWVHRLQQVPLEVIRLYPGLKRELDKIRWQYGSLTHA